MTQKCKNCCRVFSTQRPDRLKNKYCDDCFNDMGLKHLIKFENKYKMEFWDNPL